MPVGTTSTYCITDANIAAWTSGTAATTATSKAVVQFNAGLACPAGYQQLTVVAGAQSAQPFLVAYDTRVPPAADLTMFFALGFGLAFGVTRVVSYTLGRTILLIRSAF